MESLPQFKKILFFLTVSLVLSSCSPERRAVLRLTALNFKTQASDAIEAVKTIYQLKPIPQSDAERQRKLLTRLLIDPNLDFGDPDRMMKVINQTLATNSSRANPLNEALDDLKQEYIVASETFNNIEEAGLLGTESGAVTRAAEPAMRLTVKMLLLAELIRQQPPSPNNPDRALIFFQLSKLNAQFRNTSSDTERQAIRQQAAKLIDNLLSINTQERTMLCQATAKLLLTADTGSKLSQLIEKYNTLSFDEIVAKITTALGIASSFGSDVTAINTKIKAIQASIQEDAILNKFLNEQRQSLLPPSPDMQPLECSF